MRRRDFIGFLGGVVAGWPQIARAQQPKPVIGVLSSQSPTAVARPLAAFHHGLGELGFDGGKTVAIEYRWAEGQYDRLPVLAADLVRREVAVVVTLGGDPPALAAKAATSTIPIVFIVGSNPVQFGLVSSLNRPGGNATGVNLFLAEIESKRIGLLHELVPAATRIALLVNPKTANADAQITDIESATRSIGLALDILKASNDVEISAAFDQPIQFGRAALMVEADPYFVARRDMIITRAAQRGIPAIYPLREFPDAGGLMSYGTNLIDAYHQVGNYVGRILKGEKPGDLPVVQLEKFELVINLQAAKKIDLAIPPNLLARADEVIE
jgi:putative tryptophan/tyrosine transport system substrate-binding protein